MSEAFIFVCRQNVLFSDVALRFAYRKSSEIEGSAGFVNYRTFFYLKPRVFRDLRFFAFHFIHRTVLL